MDRHTGVTDDGVDLEISNEISNWNCSDIFINGVVCVAMEDLNHALADDERNEIFSYKEDIFEDREDVPNSLEDLYLTEEEDVPTTSGSIASEMDAIKKKDGFERTLDRNS